ncbi:UPF0326 protein hag1 [Zalerion maritima]|uniref:UPF0326 protein hag1 n=1 Tax=Zalerion maritima TaxID=339359 RepID=A0AAD5RSP5_9PEZI|nr:UPF0326 protein hag1 [Zalerion maritima]
MAPKKAPKQSTRPSHRSTLSMQKTEIMINVYDLLPPGRLSSVLWTIGSSLLHSGVVINNKEYAYGGHDRRGVTGVYWTRPKTEPPGGTFKTEILHGFTFATSEEIDSIMRQASEEFQGMGYNLLTKNCNHFTSYLVHKLTGRSGPGWLNRAASIGVALPCVVPREWIEPPDWQDADAELLDEDDEYDDPNANERSAMLRRNDSSYTTQVGSTTQSDGWDSDEDRKSGGSGKGKGTTRETPKRKSSSTSTAKRPSRTG